MGVGVQSCRHTSQLNQPTCAVAAATPAAVVVVVVQEVVVVVVVVVVVGVGVEVGVVESKNGKVAE